MNCKEVKPELVAYLDGELQDSIRSDVEAHLESCAACRAERENLASTLRSLESLPATEPSANLARTHRVYLIVSADVRGQDKKLIRRQ